MEEQEPVRIGTEEYYYTHELACWFHIKWYYPAKDINAIILWVAAWVTVTSVCERRSRYLDLVLEVNVVKISHISLRIQTSNARTLLSTDSHLGDLLRSSFILPHIWARKLAIISWNQILETTWMKLTIGSPADHQRELNTVHNTTDCEPGNVPGSIFGLENLCTNRIASAICDEE